VLHDAQHPSYVALPTLGACTPVKAAKKPAKRRRAKHRAKRRKGKRARATAACAALPIPDMTRG
jgi:hypothetical protein